MFMTGVLSTVCGARVYLNIETFENMFENHCNWQAMNGFLFYEKRCYSVHIENSFHSKWDVVD